MATKALQKPKAEVTASLAELEAIVTEQHELTLHAARTTVEHAVKCGEALLAIRLLLMPEGTWTQWLEEKFPTQRTTTYGYMRLARYKHLIPPGATLRDSERFVRSLPSIDGGPGRSRIDDLRKDEAKRWRAEEPPVGYKEIARRLGTSPSTVYNWFNGQSNNEKRARQLLREEKRTKQAKRLAARNVTALSEAYQLAERMRDVLGQARREARTQDARRALKRAEEYHHIARDSVVEALRADG